MPFDRSRLPEPAAYFDGEDVKLSGPDRWKTAPCPFHGGSDSLRVNTATGGWICMSCGEKGGDVLAFHMQRHGVDFIDAAKALGAWIESDTPSKHPQRPLPFAARAGLEVISFEAMLVAIAAGNLARGIELASADRERLLEAAGRIRFIAQEVAR